MVSNAHGAGALLRISNGIGLTSIQYSNMTRNSVTALVRFEGRGWVKDVERFARSTQYMDQGLFSRYQGKTKASFQQEQQDKAYYKVVVAVQS